MNIAVVGCGFVSEFYAKTISNYSDLKFVGAYDKNMGNLATFCRRWSTKQYKSLESVVEDSEVELVLNLTNPRSHEEVTALCLEAGKHVYSEKPLAMDVQGAKRLADLSRQKGVRLSSAPCSVLGETAQTVWQALHEGVIGPVRVVYANYDAGMIGPNTKPWLWRNETGIPWPAKDELEVGCTFEHAGYLLTWLAAFFGPAKYVTGFASCQIPERGISLDVITPDFSVGCVEYAEGIVARVTCSIVAPYNTSLTIIGDDGIIFTNNMRNDVSPVYIRPFDGGGIRNRLEPRINVFRRWLENHVNTVLWSGNEWHIKRKYPLVRRPAGRLTSKSKPVDFCRGPAEMVAAIQEKRPCRLSPELAVHVTELLEALQYPERAGGRQQIKSSFDPIQPLPWNM